MYNPWLKEVVENDALSELSKELEFAPSYNNRCVLCRGTKLLCGKLRCPVLVRAYAHIKTKTLIDSLNLEGSSPPAVFVGRIGYPYVAIGPLIPPLHGDTSLLDIPELWIGKSIEEIVDFRAKLVRGEYRVNVMNLKGKIIDEVRELALSSEPTDVEADFTKKPSGRVVLDDNVQPFGPSAPLKKISVSTLKIDSKLDRAYSDTDLNARDAVLETYRAGVLVSKIQRAFSVGAFGVKKKRRFVPTRWSITAVDSIISKEFVEKIKSYQIISHYEVYWAEHHDRKFLVLLIPSKWSYELIEAWYPGTVWNPGKEVAVFSSYEPYEGRTKYAEIGGCYYAARLAVSEFLLNIRRQASAIVLSEARTGYLLPVGVWHVRENVRFALALKPNKFSSLEEALFYLAKRVNVPLIRWIKNSSLLRNLLYQKRIEDYDKNKRL